MALVDVYNNCTGIQSTGLNATHVLTIINIVVNGLIGIWLGFSFKKNYETTKSVKDYFINESKQLSLEYSEFTVLLCSKKISPSECLVWFKKMTKKIENHQSVLKLEFILEPKILEAHNKFKVEFTKTTFFNENFTKNKLDLPIDIQFLVNEHLSYFADANNKLVISIIKCKRK